MPALPSRYGFVIRKLFALWLRLRCVTPVTGYYKLMASERALPDFRRGIVDPNGQPPVGTRQQLRVQRRTDPGRMPGGREH